MKKLVMLLVLCLTLWASAAFASRPQWANPDLTTFKAAQNAVILPIQDSEFNLEGYAVNCARAGISNIRWSTDSLEGTPEDIAQQLAGKADLFVISRVDRSQDRQNYSEAQSLPYTYQTYMDVTITPGGTDIHRRREQYRTKEFSCTKYVDVPAQDSATSDAYMSFLLYNSKGELLATYSDWIVRDNARKCQEDLISDFFKAVLPNIYYSRSGSYTKQKLNRELRTAEGFALRAGQKIGIMPVVLTDTSVDSIQGFAKAAEYAFYNQRNHLRGLNVVYGEDADYRLEVELARYSAQLKWTDAHVEIENKSSTNAYYRNHRHDLFRDYIEEVTYWNEGKGVPGSYEANYDVALYARLYRQRDGELMYSYYASCQPKTRIDALYTMVDDLYSVLTKKIRK